jgi:hypothetical protein
MSPRWNIAGVGVAGAVDNACGVDAHRHGARAFAGRAQVAGNKETMNLTSSRSGRKSALVETDPDQDRGATSGFLLRPLSALKDVNLEIAERRVCVHRALRLRKSTLLRTLNRMYRSTRPARGRRDIFNGRNILRPASTNMLRAKIGRSCSRSRRRSDVDLRQHRVRGAPV